MILPDLSVVLRALKIDARQVSGKWQACCPHPGHDDKSPSWFIRDLPGTRRHALHKCMSCGFAGGLLDLVMAVNDCDRREARGFLESHQKPALERSVVTPVGLVVKPRRRGYELPAGVVVPSRGDGPWFGPALRYLLDRGVTEEQIDRWGIGFAITGQLKFRVVFPVYTRGELRGHTARLFAGEGPRHHVSREQDGARPDAMLFGEPRFETGLGAVTIAEGVFSMLALERAGAPNPCALCGSHLSPAKLAILSRFPRVLVATDPDPAGQRCAEKLLASLRRSRVVRVRLLASPDDADPEELAEAVAEAGAVSRCRRTGQKSTADVDF